MKILLVVILIIFGWLGLAWIALGLMYLNVITVKDKNEKSTNLEVGRD